MTVQELIDELNKVEDKSKSVYQLDYDEISEVEESNNYIINISIVNYNNKNNMTVQELIDALNKVEDKSKDVIWFLNDEDVHCMQEHSYTVYLF